MDDQQDTATLRKIADLLEDLNNRVGLLESAAQLPAQRRPGSEVEVRTEQGRPEVAIVSKRFMPRDTDRGRWDDTIEFEVVCELPLGSRPTRAVKGLLVFYDLFGELKHGATITINDPMTPGRPDTSGFVLTYNQFKHDHIWFRTTDIQDMYCRLEDVQVIYSDGTSQTFA